MTYRPRDRIMTVAPLATLTPQATLIVTIEAMRLHLRMDPNDTSEDAQVRDSERSAVAAVERVTQRLLVRRAVTLALSRLPSGRMPIELPGGEIGEVASVVADGSPISGFAAYGNAPALLVPTNEWPTVVGDGFPVTISYTAGFSAVPPDLVAAVKLWAAHLFEHRQGSSEKAMSELPLSVGALTAPWRIAPA